MRVQLNTCRSDFNRQSARPGILLSKIRRRGYSNGSALRMPVALMRRPEKPARTTSSTGTMRGTLIGGNQGSGNLKI